MASPSEPLVIPASSSQGSGHLVMAGLPVSCPVTSTARPLSAPPGLPDPGGCRESGDPQRAAAATQLCKNPFNPWHQAGIYHGCPNRRSSSFPRTPSILDEAARRREEPASGSAVVYHISSAKSIAQFGFLTKVYRIQPESSRSLYCFKGQAGSQIWRWCRETAPPSGLGMR